MIEKYQNPFSLFYNENFCFHQVLGSEEEVIGYKKVVSILTYGILSKKELLQIGINEEGIEGFNESDYISVSSHIEGGMIYGKSSLKDYTLRKNGVAFVILKSELESKPYTAKQLIDRGILSQGSEYLDERFISDKVSTKAIVGMLLGEISLGERDKFNQLGKDKGLKLFQKNGIAL